MLRPVIVVHGGAGRALSEHVAAQAAGMEAAARRGGAILAAEGSAVEAVVEAVACLEDDPHFNAGYGATLTSAGAVEMDASLMSGTGLRAGAVAAVVGVRHPIRLARAVMERSPHLLLVGDGARRDAEAWGVELCEPEALVTDYQRRRWRERSDAGGGNTVGAVATDAAGHVAAATSTGGIFFKAPGRVGDSAVIGAGTYADDRWGAASATGNGESIIRVVLAKAVVDRLRHGAAPEWATAQGIAELSQRTRGEAGIIAVDAFGRIGAAANTGHMPLAWLRRGMRDPVVSR